MTTIGSRVAVGALMILLVSGYAAQGSIEKLTTNKGSNLFPSMAINDNKQVIVWFTDVGGTYHVRIKDFRSGKWRTHRVTGNDRNSGLGPRHAVVLHGTTIYVAWYSNTGNGHDIFLGTSTDGGRHWSASQVTKTPGDDVNPALFVRSDGTLYVTWEYGDVSARDIMAAISWNGGRSWAYAEVATVVSDDTLPVVAVTQNGHIHLAWQRQEGLDTDIIHAISADNGGSWALHNVTADTQRQANPDIAARGNDVYLAWEGTRTDCTSTYCPVAVYVARSRNEGSSWTVVPIGDEELYRPSLALRSGSQVLVAAETVVDGSTEIMYGLSEDRGKSWALKLITRAVGHDMNPVVASTSGERTHIVWQGTPHRRSELYHLESWARTIPDQITTPTPEPEDLPEPTPLPLPDITVVPQDEPVTTPPAVTFIPDPSVEPDPEPTPGADPTPGPGPGPTPEVTLIPTVVPTSIPTSIPSEIPTVVPTTLPDGEVSLVPTMIPTMVPTMIPTTVPTTVPTTSPVPTQAPSPTGGGLAGPLETPTPGPALTPEPTPTPGPIPTPQSEEAGLDTSGLPASVPSDPVAEKVVAHAEAEGCEAACAELHVACVDLCADLLELEPQVGSAALAERMLIRMTLTGAKPPDLEAMMNAAWRALGNGDLSGCRDTLDRIRAIIADLSSMEISVSTITRSEFAPSQEAEEIAVPSVLGMFEGGILGERDELAAAVAASKQVRNAMDVDYRAKVVRMEGGGEAADPMVATLVTLSVENTKEEDAEDFCIVQIIPKAFAESARDISFKQDVKVVIDDPVVLWSVDKLKAQDKIDLGFAVKKRVDAPTMSDMRITFLKVPGERCKELEPKPPEPDEGDASAGGGLDLRLVFLGAILIIGITGAIVLFGMSSPAKKTIPSAGAAAAQSQAYVPGVGYGAQQGYGYHAPDWRGPEWQGQQPNGAQGPVPPGQPPAQ